MIDLAKEIRDTQVAQGELAVCWLGQAGFLLKDDTGFQVVIDPYLTNCGEEIRSFKRMTPMLLSPEELEPDYYITTHIHFDHFDEEAIRTVARTQPKTMFFGPGSCMELLAKIGVDEKRCVLMDVGAEYEAGHVYLKALYADHGQMAPDAIGVIARMGQHCLYFSGDTAYHERIFREAADFRPGLAAFSVNGEFGNLNAEEGAQAACVTGCQYAVACHCWTFLEHRGDPGRFYRLLEEQNDVQPLPFRHGEILIRDRTGKFYKPEGSQL